MKILALEMEIPGKQPQDFKPYLAMEARGIWQLTQASIIREIYFRSDTSSAVVLLECKNVSAAKKILNALPLVKAGLISFEIIPLVPYSGFHRLFKTSPD